MLRKEILILISCVVITVSAFTGCASKTDYEKVTLVLDWTPNTNHTGFYAAKDLGYYKAEGLEIEIVQPPEDGALSLVAAGKADFGVSFEEEVLLAANAEAPLPVIAVAALVEHNTSGILSLKEKGITRFRELEGKTYGSWQIPIYDEIVRECVTADGGDPSKITFVPNSATDSISGIKRDFDSVWVYEGWDKTIADMKQVETNYLPFIDANPIFDYYTPVLVTNKNMLNSNRDKVERFLRATEKGFSYAKENPQESADILIKYAPEIDKEIIYASQKFLSTQYFSEKWGYIDEARWNGFFDWMKENGLLDEASSERAFEIIEY